MKTTIVANDIWRIMLRVVAHAPRRPERESRGPETDFSTDAAARRLMAALAEMVAT